MNIKITALVLAYNEENRIRDVLERLDKFDEIVVHDKSSQDKTREIAEKYGAKIVKTKYYNDTVPLDVQQQLREYLLSEQDNQWILSLTSSDIVHYAFYDEAVRVIEEYGEEFDVIEIPCYRYSMGVIGKHTFYGDIEYKAKLWKREVYIPKMTMIHGSMFENIDKARLKCNNPKVAIYHLTHSNLLLIMDRHWRYAKQYVIDAGREGRDRKQVMGYAVRECIRLVFRYWRQGIYRTKPEGLTQLMMLIMYN